MCNVPFIFSILISKVYFGPLFIDIFIKLAGNFMNITKRIIKITLNPLNFVAKSASFCLQIHYDC